MGSEVQDPNNSAEELRRKAIERLNSDFTPEVSQSVEQEGSIDRQTLQDFCCRSLLPSAAANLPDKVFYSSKNSQLGKARKWIWLGLALGSFGALLGSKGSLGSMGFTLFFSVLIGLSIDWFLRRQVVTREAAVVITQEGIESRLFSGKTKKYPWGAIVGVSVASNQNSVLLQLELDAAQGFPNKRNFWTGINYARPSIPLASFESSEQENLYQAVRGRLQASTVCTAAGSQTNPLTEEREFKERLKSFAPIPWVTYGLITVNVLVWIATVVKGVGITNASAEQLLFWGGNAASEFQRGEWWRLLTAPFLHSGLMHITMNMIGLASAGITVERVYGHRQFILLYFGSGLIGSALSLHFSAQHAVSVGASGAVFGISGALLVGVYQHRKQLPKAFGRQTLGSLGFFIAYSLMQGFAKQGIDNAAHIGGLMGGCLLAYVLPERFDIEQYVRNLKNRLIAGVVMVLVATLALAATAPRAVIDQKRVFEGQAAFVRAILGLQNVMKVLQEERRNVDSGKLTERESDERSRRVFAPMLRPILQDFSLVFLAPSDSRNPLLNDSKRMSELLLESLAMESNYEEGSDKPEPADPARMAAIETEIKVIAQRLEKLLSAPRDEIAAKKAPETVSIERQAKVLAEAPPLTIDPSSFSVQTYTELAKQLRQEGFNVRCWGNLEPKEKLRPSINQICWTQARTAWGIPLKEISFHFAGEQLQLVRIEFPIDQWSAAKNWFDGLPGEAASFIGTDGQGNNVLGRSLSSGLLMTAKPPGNSSVMMLWEAQELLTDRCSGKDRLFSEVQKHILCHRS